MLPSLGVLFLSLSSEFCIQLAVFMLHISQMGDPRLGFEDIEEFMHRGMCEVDVVQADVVY